MALPTLPQTTVVEFGIFPMEWSSVSPLPPKNSPLCNQATSTFVSLPPQNLSAFASGSLAFTKLFAWITMQDPCTSQHC